MALIWCHGIALYPSGGGGGGGGEDLYSATTDIVKLTDANFHEKVMKLPEEIALPVRHLNVAVKSDDETDDETDEAECQLAVAETQI